MRDSSAAAGVIVALLAAVLAAALLLPAAAAAEPPRKPADPAPAQGAEATAVLAPIAALFAAFEAGDAAAMLRHVHPDGRVAASGTRGDGASNLRQQSWTVAAQSPSAAALPTVWVLSTGGTIAGAGSSPTDLSNYRAGTLLGQALVDAVPQIKQIATVKVENLTVKSDRPVVLVGAMRPATAISADGPLNLLNAVRTAIARDARGKGALIVMNDEINGARDVTKTNTYRVETFRSPELGALGYVDDDRVAFYRASTRRHTVDSEFDVSNLTQLPKVDIVYSYVEADPAMIEAVVAQKAKGLVLAGTGAGAMSTFEKAAVAALSKLPATDRPVIVRSSRVGNGRVIGRLEFDEIGTVPADNLNPQKARILLMLALTKTTDPDDVKRMFDQY